MNANQNNSDERRKRLIVIILIIIIIIILLLLHSCTRKDGRGSGDNTTTNPRTIEIGDKDKTRITRTTSSSTTTTEEIQTTTEITSEVINPETDDKTTTTRKTTTVPKGKTTTTKSTTKTTKTTKKTTSSTTIDPHLGELVVEDDQIIWNTTNEINVFDTTFGDSNMKIAPESTGMYEFSVQNKTNYILKYSITFNENNNYHINMKYKLKKNDAYVISNYVSYDQLIGTDLILNKNEVDSYVLEWKWVSSDNDTEIGSNPASKYGLTIIIEAEETNE